MVALEVVDCKKTYDNGFEALKGINITVNSGDFFGNLGQNGAGKTTLISIVATLLSQSSGQICVFCCTGC